MSEIRFEAVEGDFNRFSGRWRLDPASGGIHIRYEAEIQPRFFVPAWILRITERYMLLSSLKAVIGRCLKSP